MTKAQALRMVEAPGTAPGSATLIPSSVYRHSRRSPADPANIGRRGRLGKRQCVRSGPAGAGVVIVDATGRFTSPGMILAMPIDDHKRAEIEAQRAVSHETRRATVPALEQVLYERFDVLDHGFVRVIDYMGDDGAIVQAARVSYGAGTQHVREGPGADPLSPAPSPHDAVRDVRDQAAHQGADLRCPAMAPPPHRQRQRVFRALFAGSTASSTCRTWSTIFNLSWRSRSGVSGPPAAAWTTFLP